MTLPWGPTLTGSGPHTLSSAVHNRIYRAVNAADLNWDDTAMSGTNVRVTLVPDHTPAGYTVLGWDVADLEAVIDGLTARGIEFLRYPWFEQDDRGVWTAPSGDRIGWFTDPDGNILSVGQAAP